MRQTQGNKILRYNSLFLGVFMFLFGFLKLFEPFRTWFVIQITKSGLPRFSIPLGKAGEMAIGLGLLSASRFGQKLPNLDSPIAFAASAGLVANMGVATYVHLQPEVPANVLPLRIKRPFIPLFVMFLAVVNIYQLYRNNKLQS
jgi:hypothetical protein